LGMLVFVAAGCVGPCRERTPMTRDRARKQSVRARMAASGEPYSVAARKLSGDAEPGDAAAVSVLRARIDATLAAPGARIQVRSETNLGTRRDLPARLARFIGAFVTKRMAPGMGTSTGGLLGEGFIEPSAGRFQIYWGGGYAKVLTGGRRFFGRSGEPVEEHPAAGSDAGGDSPLEPLEDMRDAVSARFCGEDVVRATPCQVITAVTGSREFTAWVDDVYIRRIREKTAWPGLLGKIRAEVTIEFWDFGFAEALDWSRFPGPG
jgi:hypothetical protein